MKHKATKTAYNISQAFDQWSQQIQFNIASQYFIKATSLKCNQCLVIDNIQLTVIIEADTCKTTQEVAKLNVDHATVT